MTESFSNLVNAIGAIDWSEYAPVFLFLAVIAFNLLKRLFGKKSPELEEFLKSIDEDEEDLKRIPLPPSPPVLTKKEKKQKKSPPSVSPVVKPQASYYTQLKVEPAKTSLKKEKLFSPSNIRQAIVVQTILNKPKGAWW